MQEGVLCDGSTYARARLANQGPAGFCPAFPLDNASTGRGYAARGADPGLTDQMKSALTQLYAGIEAGGGCYHFKSGFRSQRKQDELRKHWHEIADRQGNPDPRSNQTICQELAAAEFAQLPKCMSYKPKHPNECAYVQGNPEYDANGKAKGGPAKTSRHTLREAADITADFSNASGNAYGPDLKKCQALVSTVPGLCGPPESDPVHVYLEFKDHGKIGCWFNK
jgi:hypothetical protein